jgi:uncharacterized protein
MMVGPMGGSRHPTRRTAIRQLALFGLLALPAACSSPNPALYVLANIPGPTYLGAPRNIELRAVGLPRYLERSQIVRSSEDYRMDVLSNDWWGEPLDAMMGRILVQELQQRLPGSTVYSDSGAITATPDATVEINVQRFDLNRQGELLLAAQVSVEGRTRATRTLSVTIRPASTATSAQVAAMSTATAQLADVIGGMLGRS